MKNNQNEIVPMIGDAYDEECYVLTGITLDGEYHCFGTQHTILTPDYDLIIGSDEGKDAVLWELDGEADVELEVNGVKMVRMSVEQAMILKESTR